MILDIMLLSFIDNLIFIVSSHSIKSIVKKLEKIAQTIVR